MKTAEELAQALKVDAITVKSWLKIAMALIVSIFPTMVTLPILGERSV